MSRSKACYFSACAASVAYYVLTVTQFIVQEIWPSSIEDFILILIYPAFFLIFLFPVVLVYSYLLSLFLMPIFSHSSLKISFCVFIAVGAIVGGASMIFLCWVLPHLVNLRNMSVGGILGVGAPFAFVGAAAAVGAWYSLYRRLKAQKPYDS